MIKRKNCNTFNIAVQINEIGWIEDISKFNEDFIKSYNDESDERNLHNLCNDLPFLPERMKIEKNKKLNM